jgi:hypothetical protein
VFQTVGRTSHVSGLSHRTMPAQPAVKIIIKRNCGLGAETSVRLTPLGSGLKFKDRYVLFGKTFATALRTHMAAHPNNRWLFPNPSEHEVHDSSGPQSRPR